EMRGQGSGSVVAFAARAARGDSVRPAGAGSADPDPRSRDEGDPGAGRRRRGAEEGDGRRGRFHRHRGPALTAFHIDEPENGSRLKHDPLNSIVAPRPIGWVATRDHEGRLNLAPYSFFNLFSYRPPIVGFCSNGWKDSVRNCEATREFVWNLATRPLAEQM